MNSGASAFRCPAGRHPFRPLSSLPGRHREQNPTLSSRVSIHWPPLKKADRSILYHAACPRTLLILTREDKCKKRNCLLFSGCCLLVFDKQSPISPLNGQTRLNGVAELSNTGEMKRARIVVCLLSVAQMFNSCRKRRGNGVFREERRNSGALFNFCKWSEARESERVRAKRLATRFQGLSYNITLALVRRVRVTGQCALARQPLALSVLTLFFRQLLPTLIYWPLKNGPSSKGHPI